MHWYNFDGTLQDFFGGPNLISNGGTIGSGSYAFGANQGLTLDADASLAGDYSIGLQFSFQSVDGWRKVIDFQNQAPDTGQYILDGRLTFFDPTIGGSGPIQANEVISVVVTRSSANNLYTGYLNGSSTPEFSFTDSSNVSLAVLIGGFSRFSFFIDDSDTGFEEASAGMIFDLRVWDGPLLASEIGDAFIVIPEPASAFLLSMGGFLLLLHKRRCIRA